jgi:hypothetical protein
MSAPLEGCAGPGYWPRPRIIVSNAPSALVAEHDGAACVRLAVEKLTVMTPFDDVVALYVRSFRESGTVMVIPADAMVMTFWFGC